MNVYRNSLLSLCMFGLWYFIIYYTEGVTLILKKESIPTNGSKNIPITDIGNSNRDALLCQQESKLRYIKGDWYVHPTNQTIMDTDKIMYPWDQGWWTTRSSVNMRVKLRRWQRQSAVEGVFTCHIPGDLNTPMVSVGIYYPILSVFSSIQVVSRRNGLFVVNCTSTGGRALNMSVTGPDGYSSDLNSIQSLGDLQRMGNDAFSASTDVISGGKDGSIYNCTSFNGVSQVSNSSNRLRVASTPIITSLEQISATAVRVEWSQPSGGATVTGYVVHYSAGDTNGTESVYVAAFSTSYNITNLTSGLTYTFSLEATSEHLSGVSDDKTVTIYEYDNMNHKQSNGGGIAAGGIAAGGVCLVLTIIIFVIITVAYIVYKCRGKKFNLKYLWTASFQVIACRQTSTSIQNSDPQHYYETIYFKPVITQFPDEDKEVVEGEEVVFRVKVTGDPVPKLTWYLNGEKLMVDFSKELAADGTLTIPSAEIKHGGVYKLMAVNRVGRMEKEVNLSVKLDGQLVSRVPIEEFSDYVSKCHTEDNKDFNSQFKKMEDQDDNHPTTYGLSSGIKKLNRFANITVFDDNRIILRPIEGHSECLRDFINASFVDGYKCSQKFIATQGPLSKTVVDFWRMVWQEKTQSIVMVTNLEEGKKNKCHQYWPESGTQSHGPFKVTITGQQILADHTIRHLSVHLTGSSEPSLNVTQFHFTAWPDYGVPDYATSLLAFHKKLKEHHKQPKGPMLVHCSAGVGRTGTLITIDSVLDQIEKEGVVDIAGTIIHLRTQRMKMVQTLKQYIFIHDAILEAIACGDTQINASDLRRAIKKLSCRDPATHLTVFENQLKVLEKVSPNPKAILHKKALENPARNRNNDYLPGDRWRVVLKGEVPDYIHAVSADGYKQQRAFIIAQSPMHSTVRDFWKMIYDRKCGVVIMLCDLVEDGQEACYQYWPSTGMVQFGEYTVNQLDEEKMYPSRYIARRFRIAYNKKAHQVTQLHIINWSPDGHCSDISTITDGVIAEMTKIQMRTGNKPVVVHCSDTVSRSGMFCAIATTIERCKTEGVVDVFQVVKALRVQKPGAVTTVAQFQTVFEAVLVYLESFETYSNF